MEENSSREHIMKVWKGYTIEDAIIVIEKAVKAIRLETVNYWWRNYAQVLCMTSQDLQQSNQGNHERDCGYDKKVFQDKDLREIQEPVDITPEELTEYNLIKMNAVLLAFPSWLRTLGRHWSYNRQLTPRLLEPPRSPQCPGMM